MRQLRYVTRDRFASRILIRATLGRIITRMDEPQYASKFGKSLLNSGTEKSGLELLLADERFQAVSTPTKREIIRQLPVQGDWGIQTFDVVMTPEPVERILPDNVERFAPDLTLVEMKTTRKPIANAALNGFFFGATEREYSMARALGDAYRFAFIVLNIANDYAREFAVILTMEEVERRTRQKRIQYQVNFRSNLGLEFEEEGLVLLGEPPPVEP